MIRLFVEYIKSWIETLRIAPPFSKRRRDILEATRDIGDTKSWVEVVGPRTCSNPECPQHGYCDGECAKDF